MSTFATDFLLGCLLNTHPGAGRQGESGRGKARAQAGEGSLRQEQARCASASRWCFASGQASYVEQAGEVTYKWGSHDRSAQVRAYDDRAWY